MFWGGILLSVAIKHRVRPSLADVDGIALEDRDVDTGVTTKAVLIAAR